MADEEEEVAWVEGGAGGGAGLGCGGVGAAGLGESVEPIRSSRSTTAEGGARVGLVRGLRWAGRVGEGLGAEALLQGPAAPAPTVEVVVVGGTLVPTALMPAPGLCPGSEEGGALEEEGVMPPKSAWAIFSFSVSSRGFSSNASWEGNHTINNSEAAPQPSAFGSCFKTSTEAGLLSQQPCPVLCQPPLEVRGSWPWERVRRRTG